MTPTECFARDFHQPGVAPERLAVDIARLVNPELDVDRSLAQLEALAEAATVAFDDAITGHAAARRLLDIVRYEMGFTGNQEDYYDPRNSLLPEVMARRTGLPIMLCLICMVVGAQIGRRVDGLAFPAHFMAQYRDHTGAWLLDPFNGEVVERERAEPYLTRLIGRTVHLPAAAWQSVTAQMLALRILHNLRNAYLIKKDLAMVVRVLDALIAVEPAEAAHWRERALLYHREARWEETQHDLRRYFALNGILPSVAMGSTPHMRAAPPFAGVGQQDRRLLEIYQEAVTLLGRVN
jgi:regulator of sirC expression with transglutaminase-like and TPR domain